MHAFLRYADLKTRIAVMVLSLFIGTIWLLTFAITHTLRLDIEALLANQQYSTASYVADDLEQRVRQRLDALTTISTEIDAALLRDPGKLQDLLHHRPLLRSLFSIGVTVVAANGFAVTAYPANTFNPTLSFKDIEYFQQVMATGKPAVGKPRIGRVSHKPAIGFAIPIAAKDGAILGVMVGFSQLSDPTLFGSLEQANVGKTGWIAVSAPAYQLIVSSSDPKRILDQTAAPGVNVMFDKFVAGYEGSGVAVNSKGIETLTSAKQIPTAGWFAQIVLPTGEAFAPIRNMTMRTYASAVGLSLLVAFLIWLVIRHLLQPLAETSRQIEAMASRSGSLDTFEVARNDEIGVLQRGFNRLAVARNELDAQLLAQQQRIAHLSHHLISTQEEERRRLALEIHDVVSPNLATIKILLKTITESPRNGDATERLWQLEDVKAVVVDTEAALRGICADLRPTQLDYNGLMPAILDYAHQFAARTGIAVQTTASLADERLPPEVESKLFRITQEALTNSAKHAKPTSIDIHWNLSPEAGVLTIADNGVGFAMHGQEEKRGSGLGLLTMRERAEFIGGAFSLDSAPGQGTRIRVEIARQKLDASWPVETRYAI